MPSTQITQSMRTSHCWC